METFSALLAIWADIYRSPVNSPHRGQLRGALMLYLIRALINSWINNREAGDLKRIRAHYDVTVTISINYPSTNHAYSGAAIFPEILITV